MLDFNIMELKICIIGPGVVGQATGKAFIKYGFDTSFLGGNDEKRKKLQKEGYKVFSRSELFNGNYNFDVSFLTVPTPTVNKKINLDYIKQAAIDLGKRLKLSKKDYHLVVVKSTVPPGTTRNIVGKLVEKYSGRKLGKNLGLSMNPEYLREKTALEDSIKPWVILIGEYDKKSGDILENIYKVFKVPIHRCSLEEAEYQKYVHNLFNANKITFFNEMRKVAKKFNFNANKIFEITCLSCEGLWNPKYGIYDYGPFSGSCLPKDTQAFLNWGKNQKIQLPLLKKVIDVNNQLLTKKLMNKKIIGAKL
jgi:UDPglucose 6-dehydrogenase